jgi:hypothetical protein
MNALTAALPVSYKANYTITRDANTFYSYSDNGSMTAQ